MAKKMGLLGVARRELGKSFRYHMTRYRFSGIIGSAVRRTVYFGLFNRGGGRSSEDMFDRGGGAAEVNLLGSIDASLSQLVELGKVHANQLDAMSEGIGGLPGAFADILSGVYGDSNQREEEQTESERAGDSGVFERKIEKVEDREDKKDDGGWLAGLLGFLGGGLGLKTLGGLVTSVLGAILPATLAACLLPTAMTLVASVLAVGAGLKLADYLWKNWLEPWIDSWPDTPDPDVANREKMMPLKDKAGQQVYFSGDDAAPYTTEAKNAAGEDNLPVSFSMGNAGQRDVQGMDSLQGLSIEEMNREKSPREEREGAFQRAKAMVQDFTDQYEMQMTDAQVRMTGDWPANPVDFRLAGEQLNAKHKRIITQIKRWKEQGLLSDTELRLLEKDNDVFKASLTTNKLPEWINESAIHPGESIGSLDAGTYGYKNAAGDFLNKVTTFLGASTSEARYQMPYKFRNPFFNSSKEMLPFNPTRLHDNLLEDESLKQRLELLDDMRQKKDEAEKSRSDSSKATSPSMVQTNVGGDTTILQSASARAFDATLVAQRLRFA